MNSECRITLFAAFLCCYLLPNDTGPLQEKGFGKEGEIERRTLLTAIQQGDIARVESLIEEIRQAKGSLPIDIIEPAINEAMTQTQLEAMLKALVVSYDIAEIAAKHAMKTHNETALHWIIEHTRIHPRLILNYAIEHGKRDLITFIEQRVSSDPRIEPLSRLIHQSRQIPPVFGTPKALSPLEDASALNIPFERGHVPIVFLIDQVGTIKRTKQEASRLRVSFDIRGEMTVRLLIGLLEGNNKLVIASKWVTCAILSYAFANDKQSELRQTIETKWQLYTVPETQFTIWMPQDPVAKQHYENVLNISQFRLLPLSENKDLLAYCPPFIVGKNDQRINIPKYKKSDLFKLFKLTQPETPPLFDFALFGHGAPGHSMAGLPIELSIPEDERITSLLSFFNDQLNTNAVFIRSCSAGGKNLNLLQMIDNQISLNYNYLLIIGSITDKITVLSPERLLLLNNFFKTAATLDKRDKSLNQLLKDLAKSSMSFTDITKRIPRPGDIRGYSALPQVWFPGGIGFRALDVIDDVLLATKVLVTTHEDSSEPIEIHNKQVVLWYPLIIKPTVNVGPGKLPRSQSFMYRVMNASAWKHMPVVAHDISISGIQDERRALLYPEFVLMNKQNNNIWFKKINLQDNGLNHIGVLQFLRDAFCDVGKKTRPVDIVIESLEGINDIPLQASLGRRKSGLDTPGAFEQTWQETVGQRITLHDVMIRINPPGQRCSSIELYIKTPGGNYWLYAIPLSLKRLTRPIQDIWQFKISPKPPIDEFREAIEAELKQKSIGEILQKKMRLIQEMDAKEAQETSE